MLTKATILAAACAAVAKAQANEYWFIPEGLTDQFCDGVSVPDWDACEEAYVDWFINRDMEIGPGMLEGQTLTVEGCQLRYVECGGKDYGWTETEEGGLFSILRRTCEPLGAGGVRRQGDMCVIAENPIRPFGPRKRDLSDIEAPAAEAKREPAPEPEPIRTHPKDMLVSRDLIAESNNLERRQSCGGEGECYGYTQTTFAGNIRGTRIDLCQVPTGGSCTESYAKTISSSYEVSFGATTGIKDVIDVTAGFSMTEGESYTTTLSTTITVECGEGGRGRVVYYPYMEVSSGECTRGTCSGGFCSVDERSQCTTRKPVPEDSSFLSGEYSYECN
ncbi:hypothetical protein CC79DRAFT_1362009 [Sarocladium strictum]